jgi:mitochondrial import inner membrane translocase subunit TIM21
MSRLVTRHLVLLPVSSRCSAARLKPRAFHGHRSYATHKDHSPSSLLSPQFEQRKAGRSADSVGPFQLGIVQPSTQKVKKWSDLSTGGKGAVHISGLMKFLFQSPIDFLRQCCVPLLGQPIFQLSLLVRVSPLFCVMHWRQNFSPRIHLQSCMGMPVSELRRHHWCVSSAMDDILKEQTVLTFFFQVNAHLRAPLSFHNNPPLVHRPRHRNRHVNFFQARDSSGKEHLLLNFYVQGSDASLSLTHPNSESFVDHAFDWTKSTISFISDLTLDRTLQWTQATVSDALQTSKRAFAYLIGEPLPPLPPTPLLRQDTKANQSIQQESLWSLSGIFTRLTGKRRSNHRGRDETTNGVLWRTGEAHADFVKVRTKG